jgi:hypothetical protein
VVIAHLAKQLGIEEPSCLARIGNESKPTTRMPLRFSADMSTEIFINSRKTFVLSGGSTPGTDSRASSQTAKFHLNTPGKIADGGESCGLLRSSHFQNVCAKWVVIRTAWYGFQVDMTK